MKKIFVAAVFLAGLMLVFAGCNRNGGGAAVLPDWQTGNAHNVLDIFHGGDGYTSNEDEEDAPCPEFTRFLDEASLLRANPPVAGVSSANGLAFESNRTEQSNFVIDVMHAITESPALNQLSTEKIDAFVRDFKLQNQSGSIYARPQTFAYNGHVLGVVINFVSYGDMAGFETSQSVTNFDLSQNIEIPSQSLFTNNADFRSVFAELAEGYELTGNENFTFDDENIYLHIRNNDVELGGYTIFAMSLSHFDGMWQSPSVVRPRMAITFDDGPHYRLTANLLDALATRNIKGTFFVLGANVADNADLIMRMYNEGHEIGNHSFAHPSFTNLPRERIMNEITATNDAIYAITGETPTLLRPPFGNFESRERTTINIATELGMTIQLWSIDPRDWEIRNATTVRDNILALAKDGSVILLHDIHETSIQGAIMAIDILMARGYDFVTVSELYRTSEIDHIPGSVHRGVYWDISRRDRGIFD